MKLRYDRVALADLDRILAFIAEDDPRAAARTVGQIRHSVERLTLFPHSGRPGIVEGTREVVVPGLPYIVVYRVAEDAVDILAVFHGAQDR